MTKITTGVLWVALLAASTTASAGSRPPAGSAAKRVRFAGIVNASQIVIGYRVGPTSKIRRSEAQAKRLAQKLARLARRKPSRFATLARRYSDDAATRARGGDLGVFTSGRLSSQALERVLFGLKVGAVSPAVFGPAGYYVFYRKPRPKVIRLAGAHILISFKGAMRARPQIVRSKAQALALARSLRAKLDATPSDFDRLARKHSDGPSAAKGGRLGHWTFGRMVKPFDHGVLRLRVGTIGGPVLTRFGYHLIRRDPVP
jgi:parvulin-like peptidyl-prolyl isomerase